MSSLNSRPDSFDSESGSSDSPFIEVEVIPVEVVVVLKVLCLDDTAGDNSSLFCDVGYIVLADDNDDDNDDTLLCLRLVAKQIDPVVESNENNKLEYFIFS